jgi:hypothetical protein
MNATQATFETVAAIKFVGTSDTRNWGGQMRQLLMTEYKMVAGRDYRIECIKSKRQNAKQLAIYFVPLTEDAEKLMLAARWEWFKNDHHVLMTGAEVAEEVGAGNYCKYI